MRYLIAIAITVFLIIGCANEQLTEEGYFTRAQQYENALEFEKAIADYTTLMNNFPESDNRYKAMFMIGFLSYENLKNSEQAISYFDRLLSEYPECDLADDATALKQMALEGKDLLSVFEDSVHTE